MKRQEIITVDLKVTEYCPLKLKQFDTTEMTFDIYDDSTRVNLEGMTADLVFTKSNNTIVMQECDITNNQVVVNLLPDCVRLAGESKIEVELKKNNEVVSSFFIPVKIEPSSKEKIKSDNTPNYIEILEDAIELEKERQKNEQNRITAENNRNNAEGVRSEAETQRNSVEATRVAAETDRAGAETQRSSAEEARVTAETSRAEAEAERIANENARITSFENMSNSIKPAYSYVIKITETTSIITLPVYYKVGANVLTLYGNGEKMIKSSALTDLDGHYVEVGEEGSLSNQIQCVDDMEFLEGDVIEVIIKGVYENGSSQS